jgi:hypothetical protein
MAAEKSGQKDQREEKSRDVSVELRGKLTLKDDSRVEKSTGDDQLGENAR